MNKIIMSMSVIASGLLGYTAKQDGTRVEEALTNVQYVKSWVLEDLNSGAMDTIYAEYYLDILNETEDILIEEFTK
jgi:hypothetical protein